jgi:hypothetical protein
LAVNPKSLWSISGRSLKRLWKAPRTSEITCHEIVMRRLTGFTLFKWSRMMTLARVVCHPMKTLYGGTRLSRCLRIFAKPLKDFTPLGRMSQLMSQFYFSQDALPTFLNSQRSQHDRASNIGCLANVATSTTGCITLMIWARKGLQSPKRERERQSRYLLRRPLNHHPNGLERHRRRALRASLQRRRLSAYACVSLCPMKSMISSSIWITFFTN